MKIRVDLIYRRKRIIVIEVTMESSIQQKNNLAAAHEFQSTVRENIMVVENVLPEHYTEMLDDMGKPFPILPWHYKLGLS